MKLTKYLLLIPALAAMTATTSCDTCDLEPVMPPVEAPSDTTQANMTILDFKKKYWNTSTQSSWNAPVGLNDDGDTIILRGRITSSDITGNLFKTVVVRDESAAISISVDINDLYHVYPYGAEVVVKATGLYCGMNNNNFILGGPKSSTSKYNNPGNALEKVFKAAAQCNGWPDSADVKPVELDLDFLYANPNSVETRQEWQGRLVTVNNVQFENAGEEYSPIYGSSTNRNIRDEHGNRLICRFSGRSSFAHLTIPGGSGSVTGILGFYGSDWQLTPMTLDAVSGFSGSGSSDRTEPQGTGTETDPYNVSAAISKAGTGTAWVKGYIVGSMNANANYTFENVAPFSMVSNVYIADSPTEEMTSRMLPVQLVSGTEIRSAVNLVDNPGNLGKELTIQGSLDNYFNQPGLKSPTAYKLDGQGSVTPPAELESFVRATSVSDGKYIIWADNKIGKAFVDGYKYGYMQSTDCVPAADGTISASIDNLYTFTQEAKGWTIADAHGQYLYQDTEHETFQLSKTPDTSSDYTYWTITPAADGSFTIVNCGTGKTMRYDTGYETFACYSDATKGTAVYLYQSAK